LAAAMMLDHVDENDKATRLRDAIQATINDADCLTGDLGGNKGTDEYAQAVIAKLG
jgi:isocitrate dehydrogenase (NAD+)